MHSCSHKVGSFFAKAFIVPCRKKTNKLLAISLDGICYSVLTFTKSLKTKFHNLHKVAIYIILNIIFSFVHNVLIDLFHAKVFYDEYKTCILT